MKHSITSIITVIILSLCDFTTLFAQCTCGIGAGINQVPSSTITPTTSWQTQSGISAGNYTLFNVVSGNQYTWSYCSSDGGSSSWDTRLNLYYNSTQSYITCNGDYSGCGNAAKIIWTADFTGIVRLITSMYVSSTNPCHYSSSSTVKLAYKRNGSSGQADLTVSNQSISPSTTSAGSTVQAYARENNNGTSTASANVISIHLSANSILTPGQNGDTYLGEIDVNSSISAGGNSGTLGPESITIPSSTTPGSYYVFFSADGGQAVTESDETNNFATVQITVQSPCTYSLSSYSKHFSSSGGSGSFTLTTQSNCSWTATTSENWISTSSSNTGSGTVNYSVQANSTSSPLTGYIEVGDETFTVTQDANTTQQKPDLKISNIVTTPTSVAPGGTIKVDYRLENIGNGNAGSSVVSFHLSSDPIFSSGTDPFLADIRVSAIGSSGKANYSMNMQVSTQTNIGQYYVLVSADGDLEIDEGSQEGNNTNSSPITVSNSLPLDDTYPFKAQSGGNNGDCPSENADYWSFFKYECVSYVAWKVNEFWGTSTSSPDRFHNHMTGSIKPTDCNALNVNCRLSNACFWDERLGSNNGCSFHYPVNTSPAVGAIAHWNPGDPGYGSGKGGHVAFIHDYDPNTGDFIITEYNWPGPLNGMDSCSFNRRKLNMTLPTSATMTLNGFQNPNSKPGRFIHVEVDGRGGFVGAETINETVFDMSVYPNPNNGILNVEFYSLNEENILCSIVNVLGQEVYQKTFETTMGPNAKVFDLSLLPNGIYIVQMHSQGGMIQQRIIIQH